LLFTTAPVKFQYSLLQFAVWFEALGIDGDTLTKTNQIFVYTLAKSMSQSKPRAEEMQVVPPVKF
jgi:hypothetical protein